MVAFKRPKSLRDILVRAKVPAPNNRKSSRVANCMKKCNKCVAMPFHKRMQILEELFLSIQCKNQQASQVNCNTSNVVYLIECSKCTMQYVGETDREFKMRLKEHLGYVRNSVSDPDPVGSVSLARIWIRTRKR